MVMTLCKFAHISETYVCKTGFKIASAHLARCVTKAQHAKEHYDSCTCGLALDDARVVWYSRVRNQAATTSVFQAA